MTLDALPQHQKQKNNLITNPSKVDQKQEVIVRNYIPDKIYLYDYKRLLINVAVTAAIATIVYSVLFGGM